MCALRHSQVASVVSKVRSAQQRRFLSATFTSSLAPAHLRTLLVCFRAWGVLAHFEKIAVGGKVASGGHLSSFRVYLRYVGGRPASCVWAQRSPQLKGCRLSLAALKQLVQLHRGVQMCLYTSYGLLTPEECVRRRCGGVLGFGAYVG